MKSLRFSMAAALLLVAPFAWATESIQATVNGMVCAFCAQGIEKNLRALSQVQDVYVNLPKKVVAVQIKDGQTLAHKTFRDVVTEAGYEVASIATVGKTTAQIKRESGGKVERPVEHVHNHKH